MVRSSRSSNSGDTSAPFPKQIEQMKELEVEVNSPAFIHMFIRSSHIVLTRYRPLFCGLLCLIVPHRAPSRSSVPLLDPLYPFSHHSIPHTLPSISESDSNLS